MKVENTNKKGHWVVEYTDGFVGTAFYDKTLDQVLRSVAGQLLKREVKSIEFVEDK